MRFSRKFVYVLVLLVSLVFLVQAATVISSDSNKDTIVYVTKTGSKYHRDGCRYLKKSKIPMRLEDAVKSYSPCSVCNPPTLKSN
jgi:hypothetical protein